MAAIARSLGKTSGSLVKKALVEANVSLRDGFEESVAASTKYPLCEDYFDRIDDSDKAYFLGLLSADGNNNPQRHRVRLALSGEDHVIVETLRDKLYPEGRPLSIIRLSQKNPKHQDSYTLTICNRRMSIRLEELGIVKNKSLILTPPRTDDVSPELVPDFVRGFFDGNGHFSWWMHGEYARGNFSIVSTSEVCRWLGDLWSSELGVTHHLYQRYPEREVNNWTLAISGNRQILAVLGWMYDRGGLCLPRKKQRYLDFLSIRLESGL
jgi:hypothetical protein